MKKVYKIILLFIAFKVTVFLAYTIYEHFPVQLIHFEHFAIEDVEFNDIYYSTRPENDKILLLEKEVVLVNTGSLPADSIFRLRIAELIRKISHYKPLATGIDLYFEQDKDPGIDRILGESISEQSNIVLAKDKNMVRNQKFRSAHFGIVNFPISKKYGETVREYYNYTINEKDTLRSFALQLARLKDQSIYPSEPLEYLRYSCVYNGYYDVFDTDDSLTYNNFPAIEAKDILNDRDSVLTSGLIKNKIVILGHLGRDSMFSTWDSEDKFMVPTDSSLIHNRLLMPGAVIHANAVQAMIYDIRFHEMKGWRNELITDMILIIFLFIFYSIHRKFTLHKIINLLIIFGTTIPIVFFLGNWLMLYGIYYRTGSLFLQIAFMEEFVEIADGVKKKFFDRKKR
jgi:CHASE2 domain-containing sensor protein